MSGMRVVVFKGTPESGHGRPPGEEKPRHRQASAGRGFLPVQANRAGPPSPSCKPDRASQPASPSRRIEGTKRSFRRTNGGTNRGPRLSIPHRPSSRRWSCQSSCRFMCHLGVPRGSNRDRFVMAVRRSTPALRLHGSHITTAQAPPYSREQRASFLFQPKCRAFGKKRRACRKNPALQTRSQDIYEMPKPAPPPHTRAARKSRAEKPTPIETSSRKCGPAQK